MFENLERFVTAHRPCGRVTSDVGELTGSGYLVRLTCECGATFERWVTTETADRDLLYSRLPANSN